MTTTTHDFYVRWQEPRHFAVRVARKVNDGRFCYDRSIGVVAQSVGAAIEAVQRRHPDACIQSVTDQGPVHIVVDAPPVPE